MPAKDSLQIVCAEGEGQKLEFKAALSGIAREMAAFANASGGSIFLGVSDAGKIVGVADSNRLRSQIQDIANKCDPRIPIRLASHRQVVEIIVPEGVDKPYWRSNSKQRQDSSAAISASVIGSKRQAPERKFPRYRSRFSGRRF